MLIIYGKRLAQRYFKNGSEHWFHNGCKLSEDFPHGIKAVDVILWSQWTTRHSAKSQTSLPLLDVSLVTLSQGGCQEMNSESQPTALFSEVA